MNLSHLLFAKSLATSESFTAAADECCVTHPTLSNAIAQLEEELGARLFERTTRKVAMTPFGAHVLPYIIEVLNAQSSLIQQSQAFFNPSKRLIRIGTSPLVNATLLGLMVEPFKLENPEVDIILREMNISDLFRMLDDGLLDFVFGIQDVHKVSWSRTFLYEEPLLYIPRRKGIGSNIPKQHIEFKEIANETYVMVPDACGLSRATRTLFRSHRRKLNEYSGEAMSYQVLEEWAALGVGAAILPKSKISVSGRASYPIIDKAGEQVSIKYDATWTRTSEQSPLLSSFAYHLCNVVPSIISGLESDTKPYSEMK